MQTIIFRKNDSKELESVDELSCYLLKFMLEFKTEIV